MVRKGILGNSADLSRIKNRLDGTFSVFINSSRYVANSFGAGLMDSPPILEFASTYSVPVIDEYDLTLLNWGIGGYDLRIKGNPATSVTVEYSVSFVSNHSTDMVETGNLHETNTTVVDTSLAGYPGRIVYSRYRASVTNSAGTTVTDWVDLDPVEIIISWFAKDRIRIVYAIMM